MMTLPPEYTSKCDSCTAGFFGNFCEGKYKFEKKLKCYKIFNRCEIQIFFAACPCDSMGTTNEVCDKFNGKCICSDGHYGDQCQYGQ